MTSVEFSLPGIALLIIGEDSLKIKFKKARGLRRAPLAEVR